MSWLSRRTLARVVVHTTDGMSLDGVLATVARDGIILRSGRYLDTESSVPLDGETFVPKTKIAFVQVLPPSP